MGVSNTQVEGKKESLLIGGPGSTEERTLKMNFFEHRFLLLYAELTSRQLIIQHSWIFMSPFWNWEQGNQIPCEWLGA